MARTKRWAPLGLAWVWLLFGAGMACDDGGGEAPGGPDGMVDAAEVPSDGTVDGSPPDAAPGDAAADAGGCAVDADCPEGSVCRVSTGECAPGCREDAECGSVEACVDGACGPIDCAGDGDCPPAGYCADGACAEGCRLDEPCPAGPEGEARGCDPASRACVALVPCCDAPGCPPSLPADCMTPGCLGDDDCPGGQRCDGAGACIEPEVCADDIDCLGERRCAGGLCVDRCLEDADCPGTRTCDAATGACPEAAPCFDPADCDGDRLCDGNRCVDRCPAAPCPGDQICDAASGRCDEPPVCDGDEDCRDDRRCVFGACASPCLMDADCPAARVCIEARCAEPPVCFGDPDCDPGRLCLGGTCGDRCGPENPCVGAQACGADGRCAEPGACAADADCLGDRVCVGGTCAAPCLEDAACPGSRRCDIASGRCPEAEPCFGAADCDIGRACVRGACVDACGPERPCPGTQTCDAASGQCAEGAFCVADLDCLGDRVCVAGACGERCVEDADCPGTRQCEPVSGRCPEAGFCIVPEDCDPGRMCDFGACVGGCVENRDCPAGELCADGQCAPAAACGGDRDCPDGLICDFELCVPAQCIESGECPGVCLGGRCQPRPILDCPACIGGAVCGGGSCLAGAPCRDDAICGERVCAQGAGACVECRVDGDCPAAAEYCEAGRCVLAAFCEADGECPGTRTCEDRCVAADCPGDAFDADPPGVLAARAYADLVRCDGATDRFQVDLAPGEGLQVTVLDPDGAGLRLSLDSPDLGRLTADGPARTETVGIGAAGARRVAVVIDGPPGRSAPYTLLLDRLPADACPPDGHEGPLGNDTPDTASPLGDGPLHTRLCPGDVDHFALALPAGTRVTATSDGAAQLTVLDPAGGALAGPAAEVTADAPIDGRYVIAARAPGAPAAGLDITLDVARGLAEGGPRAACDAAPLLAVGESVAIDPFGPGLRFDSLCGVAAEADAVVRFSLAEESRVRFTAPGRPDLATSLRAACDADQAAEAACVFAGGYGLLSPGDWLAVVRYERLEAFELTFAAVPTACVDDGDCDAETVCMVDGCLPPCAPDEGCDGDQVCAGGRCIEPDVCDEDADCVGRRVCLANTCMAPPPEPED